MAALGCEADLVTFNDADTFHEGLTFCDEAGGDAGGAWGSDDDVGVIGGMDNDTDWGGAGITLKDGVEFGEELLGGGGGIEVEIDCGGEEGGDVIEGVDFVDGEGGAHGVIADGADGHDGHSVNDLGTGCGDGVAEDGAGDGTIEGFEVEGDPLGGGHFFGSTGHGACDEASDTGSCIWWEGGEIGYGGEVKGFEDPGTGVEGVAGDKEAGHFAFEIEALDEGPGVRAAEVFVGEAEAGGIVWAEQIEEGALTGDTVFAGMEGVIHGGGCA